jgi:hypothetical protein
MSKTSVRLFLVVLLFILHLSLFVCAEDICWNSTFALPFEHPVSKMMNWLMRKAPISLSTLQSMALTLVIGEGVVLLTFFFEMVCKSVGWIVQIAIFILAVRFYFQVSQQDVGITAFSIKAGFDQVIHLIELAKPV